MRAALLALAVLAASCTTVDAQSRSTRFTTPPADFNFGPYPNVEADATAYFSAVLRDPDSAQYRVGRVGKAYCNEGWMLGGDVSWAGYAANVYVNARNGFGGYTGFTAYTMRWLPDGQVAQPLDGENFGIFSPSNSNLCAWMSADSSPM